MAENKFIKHLKGEQAVGSLVEIKNQNTPASFGNMPQGTSDSNVKYADVRGDVTVVANGTTAWKLNDSALTLAPIVNGDGTDYTGKYEVSGAGLWVNSTYTFPSTGDPNHPVAMIFNPNSKWVLKLCGDNLIVNDGNTLELTVVITIGSSNIISKQFTIREQANQFCKELVIDFDESNSTLIKASGLSTMQLQVLCGTADASAIIYNGMTTLTVLQRKVDAAVVSGTFANVEEVLRDGILPSDYFNNAAYIAQIEDGDSAYAVFTRDGDTVALSGWAQPIPDQTNNAGKFLTTDGSLMSWAQLTISDVDGLTTALNAKQDVIQVSTMPAGSADNVGRIVQWIGDTVRTKHDYITFTATEMSTNITAYVSYTSRLLTKIAAINTELGITVDKIKVLVSSVIGGSSPVYDVYVYEGNTEYLYEQGANLNDSYGLAVQRVSGQFAVGDYAIFEAEFDDEYLYNGCFYKCNSSIERGYKSTVFSVSITDLSLLESKIAEANTTFNINTAKLKFQLADANKNFNVYAVESDDTEHLFADTVTASYIQTTFGISIVQTGGWNAGEYFEYNVVYSWGIVLGDLSSLVDIELSSVSDGQALIYDASTDKWTNGNGGVSATYDATTKTITFA